MISIKNWQSSQLVAYIVSKKQTKKTFSLFSSLCCSASVESSVCRICWPPYCCSQRRGRRQVSSVELSLKTDTHLKKRSTKERRWICGCRLGYLRWTIASWLPCSDLCIYLHIVLRLPMKYKTSPCMRMTISPWVTQVKYWRDLLPLVSEPVHCSGAPGGSSGCCHLRGSAGRSNTWRRRWPVRLC